MPAAEAHVHDSEIERIERWRAGELERAGYDVAGAAAVAARHDIDLHMAADLIAQGCPSELALKILL